MGRAALAFAAGLGKGYIDEGQYQDKKDLLEREMALREKEAGLRIRHMEGQLGDAEQERQQRNAIDKTITDVMSAGAVENNAAAVTYEGADGVKKTAYQPDIETAKAAAQQDALERGVAPSAYEVQPASSIRSIDGSRKLFTGLSAASDAAKFYSENPVSGYSKYIALRDKLSSMPGGRKEADEMLRRAKEMRSEGVMDTLSALDAGDVSGAIRAWDSAGLVRFPAGAKIIPDANGIDPLTGASKTMYSVVGADGKTLVPNIHAAAYGHLLGAKDRATIESQTTAKKNATEALLEKIEAQRERDQMRDLTMQLRLGGAGAGAADRMAVFGAKEWDAASKIHSPVVSFFDPASGKEVENGSLRSSYLQTFNAAKASGAMTPNEAVEFATTQTTKLKELAQEQVNRAKAADKSSKLTAEQAVSALAQSPAWQQRVSSMLPAAQPPRVAPQAAARPRSGDGSIRPAERSEYIQSMRELLASEKDADNKALIQREIERASRMTDQQYLAEMTAGVGGPNGRYASPSSAPNADLSSRPKGPQSQASAPAPSPAKAPVTLAPIVPASQTYAGKTVGDRQLEDQARKAGYTVSVGNDGQFWFSRTVNGQGENLTGKQLADRLGLVY